MYEKLIEAAVTIPVKSKCSDKWWYLRKLQLLRKSRKYMNCQKGRKLNLKMILVGKTFSKITVLAWFCVTNQTNEFLRANWLFCALLATVTGFFWHNSVMVIAGFWRAKVSDHPMISNQKSFYILHFRLTYKDFGYFDRENYIFFLQIFHNLQILIPNLH